jgi:ribosomal protein S18 acetylase RimI-like enzyme
VATREIVIRKATLTDITACALLISNHVSGNLEDWQSRFEQDLANPRRHFLVATVDDSVEGYGHTTFHTGLSEDETKLSPTGYFLSGLMVSPAHRRKGLGQLLTIARIDELRQVTDLIYYRAEHDNQATIELHSRLGFKSIGSVQSDGREFALFSLELHPSTLSEGLRSCCVGPPIPT